MKQFKTEVVFRLTDTDLSQGLDYLYRKATKEILKFDKDVDKIGVLKDDIHWYQVLCSSNQQA